MEQAHEEWEWRKYPVFRGNPAPTGQSGIGNRESGN